MQKMNCSVVDDESMGRKLLEDNIHQLPFLNLVASCKNAFEAMEALSTFEVDLIFLDIQMPGMLGTQFLQTLREKPFVIFVTAYENYAIESYVLDVVDYLVKPASLERFTMAAQKAFQLFQSKNHIQTTKKEVIPTEEDFFFVNVEYSLLRISIPQITHIEGLKDYIKIFLEGEKRPVLTKLTMKSIEAKVVDFNFLRVHKSFIVNLRKIEQVKQQRIKIGTFDIPISDSYVSELMDKINSTKLV
jgi:DNA-binding LytR/AlgR family response regulator